MNTSFVVTECFNPRTHEECDSMSVKQFWNQVLVSIHALTRSATQFQDLGFSICKFQSTHSRGVRHQSLVGSSDRAWFQSTHSRGVRLNGNRMTSISVRFQSTHSRGVRRSRQKSYSCRGCFNPRTHEECDYISFVSCFAIHPFQSTHSRGVRLVSRFKVVE